MNATNTCYLSVIVHFLEGKMLYADIILDQRETLAQEPYFRSRSTQDILFVVSARVLAPVSPSEMAAINFCRFIIHIVSLSFINILIFHYTRFLAIFDDPAIYMKISGYLIYNTACYFHIRSTDRNFLLATKHWRIAMLYQAQPGIARVD